MSGQRTVTGAVLVLALFLASCGDDGVGPGGVVEGTWGADHVAVVADAAGFQVEFDCAHGGANEPLALGAGGRFDIVGTYTLEGGPVDVDNPPPDLPAVYHGQFLAGQMMLTVTLTDDGRVIGPYWLVRGAPGLLYKCL